MELEQRLTQQQRQSEHPSLSGGKLSKTPSSGGLSNHSSSGGSNLKVMRKPKVSGWGCFASVEWVEEVGPRQVLGVSVIQRIINLGFLS